METPLSDYVVREAKAADTAALRPLLMQLGYALEEVEIASRIERLASAVDHILLVAEATGGDLRAAMHVYGRPALEKPPEAVVQSLVVADGHCGSGLGRKMMALAERWSMKAGYESITLGSQVSRDGAHSFYEGLGYARYSTSHHFRKRLSES
ncbi:MAG: GNAT family N-acetyltransferase [Pseudomonadota bacterium]